VTLAVAVAVFEDRGRPENGQGLEPGHEGATVEVIFQVLRQFVGRAPDGGNLVHTCCQAAVRWRAQVRAAGKAQHPVPWSVFSGDWLAIVAALGSVALVEPVATGPT
jgi:hypothetical protein